MLSIEEIKLLIEKLERVNEKDLKKLINENKKIDRSERSKTINTKTSNKIIKDLLEKLD